VLQYGKGIAKTKPNLIYYLWDGGIHSG